MKHIPLRSRLNSMILISIYFGILLTGCVEVNVLGTDIKKCGSETGSGEAGGGGGEACNWHSPTASDVTTWGCTSGKVCNQEGAGPGFCPPGQTCKTKLISPGVCDCKCRS